MVGSFNGGNAWSWIVANVPNSGAMGNPKWAIMPRTKVTMGSACDLNKDGIVNLLDVQISIAQYLGQLPCGNADLRGIGTCDVVDVQRVIMAGTGGLCVTGQ
jgi:hypothetical protein